MTSVLFGLVVVCTPITTNSTSELMSIISSFDQDFSINGNCQYYSFKCTEPLVRKEWYTLSQKEKQNYLNAVTCLSKKSSLSALHSKFPATINRIDDFVAVHSNQSPYIHFVGHFIVWHRYYVAVYEKALRKECGYTGAQPYWNTANDLASGRDINRWGVFSNTTGFGGNGPYVSHVGAPNPFGVIGATGGGCVPGGPFGTGSTFKVNIGPGPNNLSTNNPTCLKRDFAPPTLAYCQQSNVDALLSQQNFSAFARNINDVPGFNFTGIHANGHLGIGGLLGQISDLFNSPSDPFFYMHHTNLDRVYWQWQLRNPIKRLCEIGGPVIPFDYSLTLGPAVTLDFKVDIDVMGPSIPVRDLLSTLADPLCYVYDRIS